MLRTKLTAIRDWVERRKLKRRRRRLVSAYADVGRARHDLGPGLSPTMYAYDRLLNEGLIVVVENGDSRQMVWNWPEDAERRVVAEARPVDDAPLGERGGLDA